MNVVCSALLIASYNAYLSFGREFALEQVAANKDDLVPPPIGKARTEELPTRKFENDRGNDILTEHEIKAWSERRSISNTLLGIRLSIDDAPVIGSATLFIISIWFLLSIRREYYTIYFLLKDTRQLDPRSPDPKQLSTQWHIYHGIISESVFSLYWKRILPEWRGISAPVGIQKKGDDEDDVFSRIHSAFATSFVALIFWLPVVTSVFVIVLDRISYYERSPFRRGLVAPASRHLGPFEDLSFIVYAVFTVLLIVTITLATTYNKQTESSINDYYGNMKTSLHTISAETETAV